MIITSCDRDRNHGWTTPLRGLPRLLARAGCEVSYHEEMMLDARLRTETSLALHAAVAEILARDPGILTRARARIEAWLASGGATAPLLLEWRKVLRRPEEEIRLLLTERSEHADWLRKASPFAGELPPREREHILVDVRRRTESSA